MKAGLGVLAALAVAWTAAAEQIKMSRATLHDLEKGFDQRIERYSIDDPFYLLGTTRGVYLDGFGAVFTAELNLVPGAVVTPFRPAFSKEEIEKLRQKKLSRLPALKRIMREMMVATALALRSMPPEEQIVVGVTLFAFSWEDGSGLPSQIVMQATRRSLLDFDARRIDSSALEAAIRVQEF